MKACASVSHLDGSEHLLTPEKAAEIQLALAPTSPWSWTSDIDTGATKYRRGGAEAHHRLGEARAAYFLQQAQQKWRTRPSGNSIVQGRDVSGPAVRKRAQLLELDFPGYAVGGLAVGEPHETTCSDRRSHRAYCRKEAAALLDGRRPAGTDRRYVAAGST